MKLESNSEEDAIRKKDLEITLQKLESHPDPSPELEQYMTPGDVAASLLYMAYSHGSIKEKTVCDLGCGTGRLAIGAALLGADKVLGIDIDEDAIEIARKNAEKTGVDVEWEVADVRKMEPKKFDTVIQNPPFGVQRRGADMDFLEKALKMGQEIYSIHKAVPENREFISERAKKLGGEVTHRREEDLHIPAQFKFHDQEVYRFKIDIYKIIRR